LRHGNFHEAAAFFRTAVARAPDSAEMTAKLGIALVQAGDAVEAVDVLEKAHQMGVSEDWILESLGLLFTTRGQLAAARENLEMAVEREPGRVLLPFCRKRSESRQRGRQRGASFSF